MDGLLGFCSWRIFPSASKRFAQWQRPQREGICLEDHAEKLVKGFLPEVPSQGGEKGPLELTSRASVVTF